LYNWGPGNCFFRKDLCTTRAFGRRNEAIEEFLFGKIDDDGAKAINALVVQDFDLLSKLFLCVFEYMDAQILRTPKGLDWIRSNSTIKNDALYNVDRRCYGDCFC
jgi:hypothetical protein